MASLSKVPVVPVVIWGSKDVRKKGCYELNINRDVIVSVLPSIDTSSFPSGKQGGEKLKGIVREEMLREIEKIRSSR